MGTRMQMGNLGGVAGSALNALGVDMLVRANNIANVNTPGFQAQNLSLMTGVDGQGVMVGLISTDKTPGPPVPGLVAITDNGQITPGYIEGSNTDLTREFVHMISDQIAYGANAATIRTVDDMTGMLLDMKV